MKHIIFAALALGISACASYRPIVDENAHYEKVGEARAERDIDQCLVKADHYLAKHKNEMANKSMIRGAGQGAAVGGVIGLLSGRGVGGAVGGAAIGAGVGAGGAYMSEKTKDNWKPDELKQRYVHNCLARKNYRVIGWK